MNEKVILALAQKKASGGGGSGNVSDVTIDDVSVLVDGVANIPIADSDNLGVIKINNDYGFAKFRDSGIIILAKPSESEIKSGTSIFKTNTLSQQHESTFYGLAKAAGDATQSQSNNEVGTYTDSAKSAILNMLNAPIAVSGTTPSITALSGVQYVCGEVATLDITLPASGCIDVIFQSGSTATALTITPPTGVTVKWANGFDPTSLEANTTYELNIMNGLGVAASWT